MGGWVGGWVGGHSQNARLDSTIASP
jgi:hypothetical protein